VLGHRDIVQAPYFCKEQSEPDATVGDPPILRFQLLVALALTDSFDVGAVELRLQLAPDRLKLLIYQRLRHLEAVRLVQLVEQHPLHPSAGKRGIFLLDAPLHGLAERLDGVETEALG